MEAIVSLHQQLNAANTELTELQRQAEDLACEIRKLQESNEKRAKQHSEAIIEGQELRRLLEKERSSLEMVREQLRQLEVNGCDNERDEEQRLAQLWQKLDSNRGRQNSFKDRIDRLVGEYLRTSAWSSEIEHIQKKIMSLKTATYDTSTNEYEVQERNLREWIESEHFSYSTCKYRSKYGIYYRF